jgi:hypothetical protein
MSLCRTAAVAAVTAAIATGAVTSSAFASPGDKTLAQTFPVASRICTNTAAGKERPALKPFAAMILADCMALQTAFTAAQTTVVAARTTINAQIATEQAAINAACPRPRTHKHACGLAHRAHDPALTLLHKERAAAVQAYFTSINNARHTFWAAFHSLPGESKVKSDTPAMPPQGS